MSEQLFAMWGFNELHKEFGRLVVATAAEWNAHAPSAALVPVYNVNVNSATITLEEAEINRRKRADAQVSGVLNSYLRAFFDDEIPA